jgi:hypothetical protein
MVNNTIVIQDGTGITDTRYGGTAALPEALVKPSQAGEFYWVGDGTVEGGNLKVIYNRYKKGRPASRRPPRWCGRPRTSRCRGRSPA